MQRFRARLAVVGALSLLGFCLLRAQADKPDFDHQSKTPVAVPGARMKAAAALPKGAIVLWADPGDCPAGFKKVQGLDGLFLRIGEPGQRGGYAVHSHKATVDISHTHDVSTKSDKYEWGMESFVGGVGAVQGSTTRSVVVEDGGNIPPFITVSLCQLQ